MLFGSDQPSRHLRDRRDLAALTADPAVPAPFPNADPYLLASALQKAIRRGDHEVARRAAHLQHDAQMAVDDAYLSWLCF